MFCFISANALTGVFRDNSLRSVGTIQTRLKLGLIRYFRPIAYEVALKHHERVAPHAVDCACAENPTPSSHPIGRSVGLEPSFDVQRVRHR